MSKSKSSTPPLTPEAHQNKLVSLALEQAEKELREGTASSQIITHFLKIATTRDQIELEKIQLEKELLSERIRSEQSHQNLETMFANVISALKSYTVQNE
jgi:uncharacterized protein involved in exopolysaccharide biosynthesis